MSSAEEIYRIADELRAIACLGCYFSQTSYDEDNYERVLVASAQLVAALEERTSDEVLSQFRDNMLHMSPLAGAEAAVFRDDTVLLIRRRDNGLWALPGGLTEVGETLAESAQRELWEEAGILGTVTKLLGIFDSRLWRSQTKAHLYHAVFLVEGGDDLPTPGLEATDAAFFDEEELPPLSPGHHLIVPFVFKQIRGEAPVPYFDKADEGDALE